MLFNNDLKKHIEGVNKNLSNSESLTQNQFDALVDFSYTAGRGAFFESAVRRVVESYGQNISNAETIGKDSFKIKISDAFRFHVPAGKSSIKDGIKNRRFNEIQMFLYGDYKKDATPSKIYPVWSKGTKI